MPAATVAPKDWTPDSRRRYYDPRPICLPSPGVQVQQGATVHNFAFDFLTGTKEALAAAGLLPVDMFPGEAGCETKNSVTYWARGTEPGFRGGHYRTPGCIRVVSGKDGTFTITRAVDADEQERRLYIVDPDARTRTPPPLKLEYNDTNWGESIFGSKQQLQALGLGVDMLYPGEPGGPKCVLRAVDPRGFPVKIDRWYLPGCYHASISFDYLPEHPSRSGWALKPHQHFAGVKVADRCWREEFMGSGAALVAAGIIEERHIPPEDQRSVRILPDGSVFQGAKNANSAAARQAGARHVTRVGADRYRVEIVLTEEEGQRRRAQAEAENALWVAAVKRFPRPPRLTARPLRLISMCEAPIVAASDSARAALTLVWSAPAT